MSGLLTPRRKRLLLLLVSGALLAAAGAFVLRAFNSNLSLYVTPGELAAGQARGQEMLRVGGFVQPGSLQRSATEVRFTLADDKSSVPVVYRGKSGGAAVLPDLFAEGKGAIAQGKLDASGALIATDVLAKHDENYVPPNVHPRKAAP
ncbi:MAG: cytochrome c maturation protein CcmE [Burkholderiaceae bacterium]|jgi:cytochrome c-type biogenesis protein CcmE|nr:cytochrome c maturation protein CcmE [Burkholderiaceae bacterium]